MIETILSNILTQVLLVLNIVFAAYNVYSVARLTKENKKLKQELKISQSKLLEIKDNIIIDDIKLKDTRYIIDTRLIKELIVEGVYYVDNELYIQYTPVNLESLTFDQNVNISILPHWSGQFEITVRYKDYIEIVRCEAAEINNRVTLVKNRLKENVFINSNFSKYIKLSDTYSSKEEAELVLQERKDKEFDLKVKQLEENYNKDLDSLLNI